MQKKSKYQQIFKKFSQLGALQRKKTSKNPRLLWKWVGGSRSHSEIVLGKSSQNSPKPVQCTDIME